ncbi:MAG: bifunctional DNA-formamidopyrimidine glycosylase/DNA-(apurinic or apyrimidinic site) lyase [Bryobacterales bacterium]|nr:bifunctional DNA-formamidopyrimidine glycosylase/DNA-(apurinic or apyrimidinic site) lyase [Bryobacterales bacterium]
MPELPEVETVKRSLAPHVEGRTIERVVFHWPRTCAGDPDETGAQLAGQRIDTLDRHGKYLLFRLSKQGRSSFLWIHLRMTGNLLWNARTGPYTRAEMFLRGGAKVVFHDIRKFGKWQWSRDFPARLAQLGPEPLEIGAQDFAQRLARRSARLKALLLDQRFLRGLGNIYADEALFRAKLHPLRCADSVGPRKARALREAIRDVLQESIAAGGTSINNYVDGQGSQGYFQLRTRVYGKTGQPCADCAEPVRRILVAQRSTHYCPRCQRR